MNDVHAGGVRGGVADSSSPETPLDTSRERLGNRPSAHQGPSKSHVAESSPMMTIFGTFMSLLNSFPKLRRLLMRRISMHHIGGAGAKLIQEAIRVCNLGFSLVRTKKRR